MSGLKGEYKAMLETILVALRLLGIVVAVLIGLGMILAALFLLCLLTHDEVKEIEADGGECPYTHEHCVKTKFYTYCDNCSGCLVKKDMEDKEEEQSGRSK